MNDGRQEDGVAIITGGSSGIGRTLALALARAGRPVAIVGRSEARLAETVAAIEAAAGITPLALALDVGQATDMEQMVRACRARFPRIALLVASAGIGRSEEAGSRLPPATRDLTLAEWQKVLDVNLNGVFFSNRAVLPVMIEQGGGEILNVCSSTTPRGLRGRPLAPAYSASKFAVAAFTAALAAEVADKGIRVSALFPGPVATPLIENTLLDAPFGGRLAGDSFAAAVLALLAAGADVHVPTPHILPLPQRRRSAVAAAALTENAHAR